MKIQPSSSTPHENMKKMFETFEIEKRYKKP